MATRYVIDYGRLHTFSQRRARAIVTLTVAEIRITARRNVLYRRYPGRPPRPLGLANSIYGNVRPLPNGYFGQVGSNLKYAASVEGGASPHIIRPRAISFGGGRYATGGMLVFYWEKVGKVVRRRMVRHPGQEGKHYLRNALLRVGRRRGFRVIIY